MKQVTVRFLGLTIMDKVYQENHEMKMDAAKAKKLKADGVVDILAPKKVVEADDND